MYVSTISLVEQNLSIFELMLGDGKLGMFQAHRELTPKMLESFSIFVFLMSLRFICLQDPKETTSALSLSHAP